MAQKTYKTQDEKELEEIETISETLFGDEKDSEDEYDSDIPERIRKSPYYMIGRIQAILEFEDQGKKEIQKAISDWEKLQ